MITNTQRIAAVLQALFNGGQFQIPPDQRATVQEHITALARADDPVDASEYKDVQTTGLFDSPKEEAEELAKGDAAYSGVTIEGAPIADEALAAAHDQDEGDGPDTTERPVSEVACAEEAPVKDTPPKRK